MTFTTKNFLVIIFSFLFSESYSQTYIIKDIKSFGAKGNGKVNDQDAFQKASDFFNARGGNGKLIISAGTYIVGKQIFSGGKPNKPAYETGNILYFKNVKNLAIEGTATTILKYQDAFRFGAFKPENGEPYEHGNSFFVNSAYVAAGGYCIAIENSSGISVSTITMDGNSDKFILGGNYGDVGRQIPHTGISIINSTNIVVNKVSIHNFALDGISISDDKSLPKNEISLLNSSFEYNARQGLSWVSGDGLLVKNCKFNHTGKGKLESPPGAGVDIEAENGPVRNGIFQNCEFIDNAGAGVVADSGDGGYCTFSNCTFWGISFWPLWITKPGFTFTNCNIYGSFVHGYDSPNEKDATKFFTCTFEDKPYNGNEVYGVYLVESNGKKRVSFSGCNFIANKKKLCWIGATTTVPDEKYKFTNCRFTVKNAGYPEGDFVAVIRGMAIKNCTFEFMNKDAKKKRYWLDDYSEKINTDLGGNKVIYAE